MADESYGYFGPLTLFDIEKRIVDWMDENQELKLKDFFLADLSWIGENDYVLIHSSNRKFTRKDAICDFFTKRMGKRVLELLPDDIKNYVIANRL